MTKYPAQTEAHYAKERYVYFLERISALDEVIAADNKKRGTRGSARTSAAEREEKARQARKQLLGRMRSFAGKRPAEREALASASGRADDARLLGESLRALTALAREWLSRGDSVSKILAKAARLTDDLVDAAAAAAEDLTGATTDAAMAGKLRAADAPEVNLVEGGVLFEMEEAQRCFEEAHEAAPAIARLTPGPATRHVLGAKSAAKKAPSGGGGQGGGGQGGGGEGRP